MHIWKSKSTFMEMVLSYLYVGFRHGTQVVRLVQQVQHPRRRLAGALWSLSP